MSREIRIQSIQDQGYLNTQNTSHPTEIVNSFQPAPHRQASAKNAWEYAYINSNNLNFSEEHLFKIPRSQQYIDSLFLEITFTGDGIDTNIGGLCGFSAIDEVVFNDGAQLEKYKGFSLFQYVVAMNQQKEEVLQEIMEDAGGEAETAITSKKVLVPLKLFGCSKCIFTSGDSSINSPLNIRNLPHELEVRVTLNSVTKIFSDDTGAGLSSIKLRYRKWKHDDANLPGLSLEPAATSYDDFLLFEGNFHKISPFGTYKNFVGGSKESYNMDSLFKRGEVTAILYSSIASAQQSAKTYVGTGVPKVTLEVDNQEIYSHEDLLDARNQHREWTSSTQNIRGTGVVGAKHYMIPLSRSPLSPDLEIGVNFNQMSPIVSVEYDSTGARGIPFTLLYKALWQQDESTGMYKVKYIH